MTFYAALGVQLPPLSVPWLNLRSRHAAHLQVTRSSLHAAVDVRCDDLESQLLSAESTKVAVLERQLVGIDDALERWRTESSAVRHVAADLGDTDLVAQRAALETRLESLEDQLSALSIIPVEVLFIGLAVDTPALLSQSSGFGRVIAPRAITAADLSLLDPPCKVLPGRTLQLRLILGDSHAARPIEELGLALGFAAAAMRGTAELDTSQHDPMNVSFAVNITTRAIDVNVDIPHTAPVCSKVCVDVLTLGGRSLAGFESPLRILLYVGVCVPFTLKVNEICDGTPCITPDGVMFVPSEGSDSVQSFNHEGMSLPGIAVAGLGLSNQSCWSAYYDAGNPLLLLVDANYKKIASCSGARSVKFR